MARRVYRAESIIEASADEVWRVLLDLDHYAAWNPFTIEVRSTLEVGAPVDMRVVMAKLGITISQRETLRERVAPEAGRVGRLVWGTTRPGIWAERVQTLEVVDARRCRYTTTDTIEGPLARFVGIAFGPSLDVGFEGVAAGLKRWSERLVRG